MVADPHLLTPTWTADGLRDRLSEMERHIRDLYRRLPAPSPGAPISPGATFYVRRTASFDVPSGPVTPVEWDGGAHTAGAELFATWDPGDPAIVTILSDGLYWLAATFSFSGAGHVFTGERYMEIGVNRPTGNATAFGPIGGWGSSGAASDNHLLTAIALPLVAGDELGVYLEQNSGGTLAAGATPIPQMSISRFAGETTTF